MANIPVNFGGTIVTAGGSITGSFAGMQSLGTGSISAPTGSVITGFKYAAGYGLNGSTIEATGPSFTIPAGTFVYVTVTSASLGAGSAPVIFF